MMNLNSQKIVSKFGGTSMGDATCMLRSAQICLDRKSFIVVVSATSGTTNLLIDIGQKSEKGLWTEAEKNLKILKDKHLKIADDLKINQEAEQQLKILLEEVASITKGIFLLKDGSVKALDTLMSLGERLSSILFKEALRQIQKTEADKNKVTWLDARDIIQTDDQFGKARPIISKIAQLCQNLDVKKFYVTQGFIGSTEAGSTTTLGRGGSDYSAALFAEGVSADILEIWTDVAGIASTDPRIFPKAVALKEISFKEASELATFGAKILHPATLAPAMRKNIPVFVGSSFDPDQAGTWVRREVTDYPLIRALALRKNQVLLTLTTPEMLHAHGFLFQIFKVFNDHKISIDAITTSEISVSVTLEKSAVLDKNLIQELSKFAEVQIEENLSLISLIGNNINHTSGLAHKIFSAIPEINVRMICLGASKHNFCFLVKDEQGQDAIRCLHQLFIS